ncbi:hypothetical protein AX16_005080 [Volvariella volvacea WC 439]|nr:hypothetical protein AX16_005080 [Volvariella volvacea WC 439]
MALEHDQTPRNDKLHAILSNLQIPHSFARPISSFSSAPPDPTSHASLESIPRDKEHEMESDIEVELKDQLKRRKVWRDKADEGLVQLKTLLEIMSREVEPMQDQRVHDDLGPHQGLTLEEQSNVIAHVARFSGEWNVGSTSEGQAAVVVEEGWTNQRLKKAADHVLSLIPCTFSLLHTILSKIIKPIFQSNPHPNISLITGRKLPKPSGGPLAIQDYYESQKWKNDSPGIANLVLWCVANVPTDSYESLWPLIIPPIMTLLDDYEVRFKIQGVRIVYALLDNAPKDVLKRTGIDGLIYNSLTTCLAQLNNPLTPSILNVTFPTILLHIAKTTSIGSQDRFDKLCHVLGEGIIGGIWIHAEEKVEIVGVSLIWLKEVVRELGIGSVRYLKAIVTQLVHILYPPNYAALILGANSEVTANLPPAHLQIRALEALSVVIQVCHQRIPGRWSEAILDGICRCWIVRVVDRVKGIKDEQSEEVADWLSFSASSMVDTSGLEKALRSTCEVLRSTCPPIQTHVDRILEADPESFQMLFASAL